MVRGVFIFDPSGRRPSPPPSTLNPPSQPPGRSYRYQGAVGQGLAHWREDQAQHWRNGGGCDKVTLIVRKWGLQTFFNLVQNPPPRHQSQRRRHHSHRIGTIPLCFTGTMQWVYYLYSLNFLLSKRS